MEIKQIYIRDYQKCDICGNGICFENAYKYCFFENSLNICKKCHPIKIVAFKENLLEKNNEN